MKSPDAGRAAMQTRAWTLLGALLVLGALNWAWAGKVWIIAEGREVRVPLAPVDPRSLMQGDYMALRFALTEQIEAARRDGTLPAAAQPRYEGDFGWVPIALDAGGVARPDWDNPEPALRLRYRLRHDQVWLGTNAYFFEEGEAERYNPARYGVFRVHPQSGEAVLVALADEAGRRL
ncbi:MAG: GDYXXLXY domain-containing protein [Xanthomonadales bacterium]|nr:GDYXXLXY domain-containing protein [Xanthomonadales bacterium]